MSLPLLDVFIMHATFWAFQVFSRWFLRAPVAFAPAFAMAWSSRDAVSVFRYHYGFTGFLPGDAIVEVSRCVVGGRWPMTCREARDVCASDAVSDEVRLRYLHPIAQITQILNFNLN